MTLSLDTNLKIEAATVPLVATVAEPEPLFRLARAPKPLAETFNEMHEILGWAMLALLALHIVGIIKHLVMDRDNLMPRMGVGKPRA